MPKKTGTPIVDRPKMPGEYGLPKDKKGLLPWSYVVERMTEAMRYWICTVTPDARPHATPVDGLWLNDALYFGGSPETRWQRNLTRNASMNVHLENALEVTILRGEAHPPGKLDRSFTETLVKASKEKYGFAMKPEDYEKSGIYMFRPRLVIAWKNFPKDATRWRF